MISIGIEDDSSDAVRTSKLFALECAHETQVALSSRFNWLIYY